jgi:hypothetical protein
MTQLPAGHPDVAEGASCPYMAENDQDIINPLNKMPAPNQKPHPTQKEPLSAEREVSSIPMVYFAMYVCMYEMLK